MVQIREHLLFVAPAAHERLYQRHQALAQEFARAGWHVWYMNPICGGGLGATCRALNPSLAVIQTRVPWRAAGSPLMQRLATWAAFSLVRRHFSQPEAMTFWIADPAMADGIRFSWKRAAYDRCDRHGAFPGQCQAVWAQYERHLFTKVHAVFCSSPLLAVEARDMGAVDPVLLPNAVGSDWLAADSGREGEPTARSTASSSTAAISGFSRPTRLVSSGAHFEWTDFDWLERWADLADVELHLAGEGRGAGFARLLRHPRVTFHGALDRQRLKSLLHSCHIGLVPFIAGCLTEAVDPVKVYEYAAVGLRVAGSSIRGLADHPLVTTTLTSTEINAATLAAILAKPQQAVTIPTWADRAKPALQVLRGGQP
jgi:hypothetical protein